MMLLKSNDQKSHSTYLSSISLLGFVFLVVRWSFGKSLLLRLFISIVCTSFIYVSPEELDCFNNKAIRVDFIKKKNEKQKLYFLVWLFLFKHNFKRRAAWKYKLIFVFFRYPNVFVFPCSALCLALIEWLHHTNSALSSFSICVSERELL